MEWREENENIHHKVSDFWNKQMPGSTAVTPNASEEQLESQNKTINIKSPVPREYYESSTKWVKD